MAGNINTAGTGFTPKFRGMGLRNKFTADTLQKFINSLKELNETDKQEALNEATKFANDIKYAIDRHAGTTKGRKLAVQFIKLKAALAKACDDGKSVSKTLSESHY